ncbi:MAG TPA: thioredoxin domain-containing protein [Candidatus Angelobacter sp.]|jgi:protein-disulfide isomerase|nr:thioredoxin domain-containing protein [Candidatus Angelobacter sp.]
MKWIAAIFISASAALAGAQAQPAKHTPAKPAHTAQTPGPRPILLPSNKQIDESMQRVFGYDPAITWNILDISQSSIPGLAEVTISVNKQQPYHLFVNTDTQTAIVGQLLPFGPNPFESAREKLKAADGPSRGAKQPVVELVEFSDLQCPHCKAAAPVLEKLAEDFPQIRLIFQQFPLPASLHPWAMKAAQYADCAGQKNPQAFWKYIDAIFAAQGSIALATADDKLKELATESGLNAEELSACSTSLPTEARISKSMELGKALDVTGTPAIFLNGRSLQGVAEMPYDQLKKLVQFEIDHAGK